MKSIYWRMIPLVLFSLLIVFFWRGLSLDPHHLPSVKLGQVLPAFSLPVIPLSSQQTTPQVLTPAMMLGKPSLLNVWASWCEACTEEQVVLMDLARQGVVIYGFNYKDNISDATNWLKEWGNPYQLVGSDLNGQVAIDLGVYGAPETFLIDGAGVIQYRHTGIMTKDVWLNEFLPRLAGLEKQA